jgi:hypothetical protein
MGIKFGQCPYAQTGSAKPTPSLAANTWSEKRCVGWSLMPAAERSELFSARVGWLRCAGLP